MFIGHFAAGFAAKRLAPRASLGTLLAAANLLDGLFFLFVLLGWEHVRIDPGNTPMTPLDFYDYPFTHSLAGTMGVALLFALIYGLVRRRWAAAGVVALAVLSHWALDLVSHRPDLPLAPGTVVRFGLGLWYSVPATVIVEGALFVLGVAVYLRSTRARNRRGGIALWILVGLLAALYIGNILGPPPPSVRVLAIVGSAGWILVPWAVWVDRNRDPSPAQETELPGPSRTTRAA